MIGDQDTSRNASKTDIDRAWDEARAAIFNRLDVIAECESWGIRFTGKINANGYAVCHAIDRPDTHPSAGFSLDHGGYKDFGGEGRSGSFWKIAEEFLKVNRQVDVLRHYSNKFSIPLPRSGGGGRRTVTYSTETTPPPPPRPAREIWTDDLQLLAWRCHRLAVEHGDLDRLAAHMGAARHALDAMWVGSSFGPCCDTADRPILFSLNCTTWPEVVVLPDGTRFIRNIITRPWDKSGDKLGLFQRMRGLYLPRGWAERVRRRGQLWICEGGSDVAAALTMGLAAIGYAMAGSCGSQLVTLLRGAFAAGIIPRDLQIILTQDIDKGGGESPATPKLACELADALGVRVWWRPMPENPGHVDPPAAANLKQPKLSAGEQYGMDHFGEAWLRPELRPRRWSRRFKDVRVWLQSTYDSPHEFVDGWADGIGPSFVRQVFGDRPDEMVAIPKPQPASPPAPIPTPELVPATPDKENRPTNIEVFSPSGVTTETRECIDQHGAPDVRDSLFLEVQETISDIPPVLVRPCPTLDRRVLERLAYGTTLHTCPHIASLMFTGTVSIHKGRTGVRTCKQWTCLACGAYRRFDWATAINVQLSRSHTLGADFFIWRGTTSEFTRSISRSLGRRDANYYKLTDGAGPGVVVVADKDFPKAAPITVQDAHDTLLAAIVAWVLTAPTGGRKTRLRPISASLAWCRRARRGPTEEECHGLRREPETYDWVLREMGVEVKCKPGKKPTYDFPGYWEVTDIRYACKWAKLGCTPANWHYGLPVPSPGEQAYEISEIEDPPTLSPGEREGDAFERQCAVEREAARLAQADSHRDELRRLREILLAARAKKQRERYKPKPMTPEEKAKFDKEFEGL